MSKGSQFVTIINASHELEHVRISLIARVVTWTDGYECKHARCGLLKANGDVLAEAHQSAAHVMTRIDAETVEE